MTWLFLLLAYLVGATPTSYLVARRFHGLDLRWHGSGNLGATNTFRVLGWKAALPVMLVDVAKGWLPTALFPLWDGAGPGWALAYGAAAIVGHVFPVYVGFRGGKGVATSGGVFLALAPWAVLVGFVVWGVVVAATRTVSIASIAAAALFPVAVYLTGASLATVGVSIGLAVFVVHAHRSNIRRLLRGEEPRFSTRREGAG